MKNEYENWSEEDLLNEINKLKKRKKYGLVWVEKSEEVVEECKNKFPILENIETRNLETDNHPTNLLIEGDNYHSLSVLNYTHKNKFDFIYIDPPYNTGNNTWKYNNNYIDEEDPYKHSKWVSFMNRRLKLAKGLLKKEGVLCVTIDNYELHNLRHLMEEIFADKEIIITIIEHNFRGRAKNNFALTHEYAVWAVEKGKDIITKQNEISDDIRRNLRRTGQGSRRHESPTLFYGIKVDKTTFEILGATEAIPEGTPLPKSKNENIEIVYPIDTNNVERRWYYGISTMLEEAKKGNVYAKEISGRLEIHYWKPGKPKRRKSVWSESKFDSSTYGSELLTEVIGENDFPFPKSIYAVMECIESGTSKKDALILDFFAGSGTTGHATLELNKKDGGNRRFVLCTNNENGICDEIIYPRLKNVITGYEYRGKSKETLLEQKLNLTALKKIEDIFEQIEQIKLEKGDEYDDFKLEVKKGTLVLYGIKEKLTSKEGIDANLRYYKTDFIDSAKTDANRALLTQKAVDMLCIKEGAFDSIRDKTNIKIFENHEKFLAILLNTEDIDLMKEEIKKLNKPVSVYIFSLGNDLYEEHFEEFGEKVTLSPIPEAIYKVYKRIFR